MPLIALQDTNGVWQQTNWNAVGLPTSNFRVYIRGGRAEYRPTAINGANSQTRARTLQMLVNRSPLNTGLLDLIQRTDMTRGLEHSAYILGDGNLTHIRQGTASHAPSGDAPPGNIIGFIHTHPVPAQILAPPSANDFGLDFRRLQIQLVAEMAGRVWQLFAGRYSSFIGYFNTVNRQFFPLSTDASANYVYEVISDDQLRMEGYEAERLQQRRRMEENVARLRAMRRQ